VIAWRGSEISASGCLEPPLNRSPWGKAKMSRVIRPTALVFVVLQSCLCLAAEKAPWEALVLECGKLNGTTFYFEKALESKLDVFKEKYSAFLTKAAEEGKRSEEILGKVDEIVAEVNRIVGALEEDFPKDKQKGMMGFFLTRTSHLFGMVEKATVYLAKQETIKDYLRKGGELPFFTYDRESDTANYRFELAFSTKSPAAEVSASVPYAVKGLEKMGEDLKSQFGALSDMVQVKYGVAFHELAEITMLKRLRAPDPYFRWFSDGFANAIAERLLRKYVSEDAAQEYASGYDTSEYSDIEKEVNLYYWMGLAFCIKTPLESEDRLNYARYAYATFEAKRLVEKHGIEVVKKILDKACERPTRDSRNLVEAVEEVTGEDIEERFKRYQTFATREEGIRKYPPAFNEAMKRKDYESALTNLLRIQEVRGPDLRGYANAAYLLFRMGHEEAGDLAIKDHLELLEGRGLEKMHLVMQKLFIDYSFKCGNVVKAQEIAEAALEKEPDFVPALTVRLDRLGRAGKIAEAKGVARRVLELEKDENSPHYKLAKKVLAIGRKSDSGVTERPQDSEDRAD